MSGPVVGRVLSRLEAVRRSGSGWSARCPAHEDHKPSLSVTEGDDGQVLLYCHHGCEIESILKALDLDLADLFPPRTTNGKAEIGTTYPYVDERGDLLFEVVRLVPKDFRQRRPDGHGGWVWNLKGVRRVLFHLPQLIDAVAQGEAVCVVEGERDVLALEAVGHVATTNSGGAGKWRPEYAEVFRDSRVVVVADKDEPGRRHARQVTDSLRRVGAAVTLTEPAKGKDVSDHLAAGLGVEDLVVPDGEGGDHDDAETGEVATDTAPPTTREPNPFIDRDGLDAEAIVAHVRSIGPVAMGADGRLWAYHSGVWRPDGEGEVGRRVREALGRRFRTSHLSTVTTWLRQDRPTIYAEAVPQYVNVVNGLLDWRTGTLEPHRPDVPSTAQLPVLYDPEAVCPAVDQFLSEVLDPDDPDAASFIEEFIGYCVYSGNPLHVAALVLGPGRNGKGTFLRLVRALVGRDNSAAVPLHVLAENRFAAASLYGQMLNVCGDLDSRYVTRTDLFKMATGGDVLHAEHKYGQPFAFTPWATMLFSANEAPSAADTSEGYYSRWVVIPFGLVIPPERRLPEHVLDGRLHQPGELSGLLNRAVSGLRRLMERGRFDPPKSVLDATSQFRLDTDGVAGFDAECLVVANDLWLPRTDVYNRYRTWCEDNGRKPLAAARFFDKLRSHAEVATRRGTRGFRCGKSDEW